MPRVSIAKRPRTSVKRSYASRSRTPAARVSRPYTRAVAIARPSVGLGMSTTTVLRTSFFVNVTAAAGTGIFTGYLKPGSIFDPCGDLAAYQPQMYDQFALAYNRYKVNSFTCNIKVHGNVSAAGDCPKYVAVSYPATDPTALGTYQGAASQQLAKTTSGSFSTIPVVANVACLGDAGKVMYHKYKHSQVIGVAGDAYDNGALVNADPNLLQYAVLPIFLQGVVVGAHTWILEVDMWQNVTFSQKKNTVDA